MELLDPKHWATWKLCRQDLLDTALLLRTVYLPSYAVLICRYDPFGISCFTFISVWAGGGHPFQCVIPNHKKHNKSLKHCTESFLKKGKLSNYDTLPFCGLPIGTISCSIIDVSTNLCTIKQTTKTFLVWTFYHPAVSCPKCPHGSTQV